MQGAHTREHVHSQSEQNRAVYPPLSTEFLAFVMYLQPFKIILGLALRTKATTDYYSMVTLDDLSFTFKNYQSFD